MTQFKDSKQTMGLFLTPDWLHDYSDMEEALVEAAKGGFGIIIGFARHMRQTVLDAEVRAAIKHAAETSHELGMKFALDMDWCHWANISVEREPEMALWQLVSEGGACHNGQFELCVKYEGKAPVVVEEISAVFAWDAEGKVHVLSPDDYECDQSSFASDFAWPSLDDDQAVSLHKPRGMGYYCKLNGRIKAGNYTRVRVYLAMRSSKYPDVSSPEYLRVQSDLLSFYNDVPMDGVGWDEPGKGGSMRGHKAGKSFLAKFQEKYGYDLRERLLDLDVGESHTAVQTRRDYYAALVEMNFQAQNAFNQQARAQYGEDAFLGTHHTYSGMPMDIRCGVMDYFKLGEVLSAAFTDTGWDVTRHAETVYNYTLVDSLRKELGKPLSYVNDWSKKPRTVWYDYYTRLKMLYRIEWFMIFLGRHCENFPTFPWDPYWKDVTRNAEQLESFRETLPSDLSVHSEMAVWFSWESQVCHERSWGHYVRLWVTCNYNLAEQGLEHSRFFDYVSTAALENAEVRDGQIIISGQSYRRLTLPYASMVSAAIWDKLKACREAGIELIFIGPPPSRLWDKEVPIDQDFAEWAGVKRVNAAEYDAVLKSQRPVPSMTDWEPDKADFRFPVTAESGTECLKDIEGDTIGVRRKNVTWFSNLDPRENFYKHLASCAEGVPAVTHYGKAYYRWYASSDSETAVLVCIAPMYAVLHESFDAKESRFRLEGGTWGMLQVNRSDVTLLLGDSGTQLLS
ncbi:hypothetical protein [Coraliomargarita parva]|uniref:hypothetical protein n=1 Tax=Coraliomargarita parva TaxID=3014050 RepID=UPI0022B5AF4E|nr:hypothetical protein [Coraliomargarita parva]